MKIISHYQRDELLHDLYNNEELLTFVKDVDWFYNKVYEIWEAYYEHVKMPIKFQNVENDHNLWLLANIK